MDVRRMLIPIGTNCPQWCHMAGATGVSAGRETPVRKQCDRDNRATGAWHWWSEAGDLKRDPQGFPVRSIGKTELMNINGP